MTENTTPERQGGVVLVTGGAGFIGCAIAPELVKQFDRVVAVDNLHPQIHSSGERPEGLHPDVELVMGDITLAHDWDRVLQDVEPSVIVHLAAETGTGQSLEESNRHAMTNVVGTTQMLDALNRKSAETGRPLPNRIVLTSSRAVYGEGAWTSTDTGTAVYPAQRTHESLKTGEWDYVGLVPTPMDARTVFPAPVSVYGATKLAQEHIIRTWANSFGVESVVLRLQNVYGPGQSLINPYTGIMSLFCRMAMGGKSIPLYEDGEVRRDFILIDDIASAVVQAVLVEWAPSDPVDIGSGEDQTILTAAELIAQRYGAPKPHVTGQFREGDVRHAWADITRAKDELGWAPRFSLEQGINRLADWIDVQPGVEPA